MVQDLELGAVFTWVTYFVILVWSCRYSICCLCGLAKIIVKILTTLAADTEPEHAWCHGMGTPKDFCITFIKLLIHFTVNVWAIFNILEQTSTTPDPALASAGLVKNINDRIFFWNCYSLLELTRVSRGVGSALSLWLGWQQQPASACVWAEVADMSSILHTHCSYHHRH